MLTNPMLDVAIGLILMYLLLSIIVTVIQEFISSTLKLRNKNLGRAIAELIGPENKKEFFQHPLIFPLFQGRCTDAGDPEQGGPAYIPKRNFALAVLDLLGRNKAVVKPSTEAFAPAFALAAFFEDKKSGVGLYSRIDKFGTTATEVIDKINNETVKKAATGALTAAVGELKSATDVVDSAVNELEKLFDGTMDRAAGWYKVNVQRIAFAIGVLVALVLNADTIYVARQLAANDDLRARAVAAADTYYTSASGQDRLTSLCRAEGDGSTAIDGSAEHHLATSAAEFQQWEKVKDCVVREINDATAELAEVGYPIGWTGWEGALPTGQPGQNRGWAIVGILMTGLALSLGASFWFDLLGKFMNVRMAGKREATESANSSNSEKQGEKQ